MAHLDQIDDLRRFAEALPTEELEGISLDEVYDRWRAGRRAGDDELAIQDALDSFDRGERGRPVEEFLAEYRQRRAELGDTMEPTE